MALADWPQILGENRDGQASQKEPLKVTDWPGQLQPLWSVELGAGYSGAAIADGVVYAMHRRGDQEFLQAMDLITGAKRWESGWPTRYVSTINPDDGPRCVPTVIDGKAYCYGASGDLVCIQTTDGKQLWNRPLRKELKADDGYFGAGSSPLVVDGVVIVNVGGKSAGIVGLDTVSGKTLWSTSAYDASYASPIALNEKGPSGKPLAMVVTRLKTVVLDSGTGKVQSEIDFGARGPTVNAAMPLRYQPGKYLLTASYGVGATFLEVASGKMKVLSKGNTILSSQYNSPVLIGNRVIGIDGREDVGSAGLCAFDPQNMKKAWENRPFLVSHLIGIGTQVLVVSIDGKIQLIDATADDMKTLASSKLPEGVYRALPAMDRGILVVRRSNDLGSQCMAIRLADSE